LEKISKKYLINSLRNINKFFYISNGIGDIIKQINPEANIYFTPNPVENATSKTNKEYNKSSNPIKSLLYVGRLDDKPKNISFLLKGLSKSKSGWKLTIIGDGPDRQKLEHLADILGISNNITWTGFKKEPFSDIREIDALILTSRYEGLPTVLIEANQNGIPFISSNCLSGPEDIVIPGINGHLFSEGNSTEFIAIINRLIDGKLLFASPEEIIKTTLRYSEDNAMKLFFNALEQVTEYSQKIQQNESKENV
jgi:Glycosyltransferase